MFGVDWLFGASGLVSVVSLGLIVWGWLFRDGYLGLIELVVWDKLVTWGWFVDVVCLGLVGWLGPVVCSTFTGGGCECVSCCTCSLQEGVSAHLLISRGAISSLLADNDF